jgi:hypothetical protein
MLEDNLQIIKFDRKLFGLMFKQHKAMIAGIAVCAVLLASFYVASAEFSQKALAQNSTAGSAGANKMTAQQCIAPCTTTNATKLPSLQAKETPGTVAAKNMSTAATAANMTNATGK